MAFQMLRFSPLQCLYKCCQGLCLAFDSKAMKQTDYRSQWATCSQNLDQIRQEVAIGQDTFDSPWGLCLAFDFEGHETKHHPFLSFYSRSMPLHHFCARMNRNVQSLCSSDDSSSESQRQSGKRLLLAFRGQNPKICAHHVDQREKLNQNPPLNPS